MTRTNLYNKNSNMLERFVIEGVWYVNDMSISDGIFGQLNYNPEKIILELKGSFTNNLIENSTIYGFSTDGDYCHAFVPLMPTFLPLFATECTTLCQLDVPFKKYPITTGI